MIRLHPTEESELTHIASLEQRDDIRQFIASDTLEKHHIKFSSDNITYLTIKDDTDFAGYMILVYEAETDSVECARLVVSKQGQGIGQQALELMEAYCKTTFQVKRIWLDVFDFNERGYHIYSKLGYQQFDTGSYQGKTLLYLEKFISEGQT